MTTPSHFAPVRGTFLLAQSTFQTLQGQWIIAGTLNQIHFPCPPGLPLPPIMLHGYVRAQVERAGHHVLRLKLIDRSQPATEAALWELGYDIQVADPLFPLEMGFQLPILSVNPPQDMAPGKPQGMHLTYWARIDDHELASADLRIILSHPDDYLPRPVALPPSGDL